MLLESYVHYKRCDMVGEQAGVLNRLGFLSIHLGDVETAIRHLQTCIALYNHLGDESGATIVSMNLASVCYSVGSLSMAVNIFKGIFTSLLTQDARSKAIYFSNYSIPYALRGDFRTARETIAKAVPYLKDYVREQAIYYENLGWIHLLEEEYVNAEKALLDGLAISLRIAPQSALVSQIKRRLADAYLGQAKYDLARQNADEALIVAEKIGERVEIAACYVVYGQLATIDGQKSTARQWFAKALDIYSMTGSRYELASTRYQAAASGIYQNGEQKALLYLARDYFVSEEVSHYVRKVDRELKKLPPGRPAPRPTAVTTFCRLTDIFYLTDPMILGKIRPRRGKEGTGTTCPDSAYLQD